MPKKFVSKIDRELARGCGSSGYWTKPLDVERVLAEIDVVLGLSARSSASQ